MQRKPRPHGKFLSIRDAEAEYGLPYHTIYRWVERGQLARLDADVVGKAILIKRADLEAFLASNMTEVTNAQRVAHLPGKARS